MKDQPLHSVQAEIQRWADRNWNGEYWPPLANLARLIEETGEIARLVNQQAGHKRRKSIDDGGELATEFGDALFALTCLANSLDIDLQAGFEQALAKYQARDIGEAE